MRPPGLLPLLLLGCAVRGGHALPVPPMAIASNSSVGYVLIRNASHVQAFSQQIMHFTSQSNQMYCSVATAAMMLNSLVGFGLPAPTEAALSPFQYHTEATVLTNECVRRTPTHLGGSQPLDARFVAVNGVTLPEWAGYLSCFANVTAVHASTSSAAGLRATLAAAFSSVPAQLVGLNFHRQPLGMVGGGHMSPVGAYDNRTDRLLVLDVSRYKYPPMWVPVPAMFDAMNTTDSDSGKSRGWVVVSVPADVSKLPPLPRQPPEVSGATVRTCIKSLLVDDPAEVARCLAGGAPLLPPAPPCPAPAPSCGGGGGALTTITIILAMMTVMLGALLYQEKKLVKRMEYEHELALAPNGNIGGMSGPIASRAAREHEGVAMLPR